MKKKKIGKPLPRKGKILPIKYVGHVPKPPIKKKIKPKLPDISTALLRYRNDALEHHEKYMAALKRLNAMLPDQYRVDLEKWFGDTLYLIERQIIKYRSDYVESKDKEDGSNYI